MEKEHDQISAAMLQKTSEAVIATNSTGQIRFINALAENLTGWTKAEALGKDLKEVFMPLKEVTRECSLEEVLASDEDPELISRSGTHVRVEGTITPIKDYKQRVNGLVLAFNAKQ
jgi:PAS domain S-box-containing protein